MILRHVTRYLRIRRRWAMSGLLGGLATAALSGSGPLSAEPSATELIFDAPYLARVEPGTSISYDYRHHTAEARLGESFDERFEMSVSAARDAAARNAAVAITRGAQNSEAGPFEEARGNPVPLILLEREVKEIAALSKGNPFYIRSRLRDAIGTGIARPTEFTYQGRPVKGWSVVLTPFRDDPHRAQLLEIADKRYEFIFSDEVPGGLYAIRVVTPKAAGGSLIETSLVLAGSTPPAVK